MLDQVRWIRFRDVLDDTGRLTAVESGEHVPFQIARVFLVHQVRPGADRGGHAHRDTDQVLSCVRGQLKVDVSDGSSTQTFVLEDAASGVYVPRMLWIRLYEFTAEAILAVYANTRYDRSRSIRTWEEYLTHING
jgi:dTDP-4-dehydrorhamnose 3,5-epimerase-like enzyme